MASETRSSSTVEKTSSSSPRPQQLQNFYTCIQSTLNLSFAERRSLLDLQETIRPSFHLSWLILSPSSHLFSSPPHLCWISRNELGTKDVLPMLDDIVTNRRETVRSQHAAQRMFAFLKCWTDVFEEYLETLMFLVRVRKEDVLLRYSAKHHCTSPS